MGKNWERREQKLRKRRSLDMVVSNRSIFVVDQADGKRNAKAIAKAEQRARLAKERGYA